MKHFATLFFTLALVLTAAGCTSARGAYDDAMQAELAGDLPTAFDRYYTALRRDSEMGNARGRLAVVGRELVAQSLAEASGAATPPRAADLYLNVERHAERAAEVGVTLALPATFASDRDASFGDAIAYLQSASRASLDAGDYSRALDALSDARAYQPSASEQADLDLDARDVYLLWAEADLDAGQFRRAYTSAGYALGYSNQDQATLSRLQSLQSAVLDAGSIRVAFFPMEYEGRARGSRDDGERGPVGGGRAQMPRDFADDLDDVLNDDHWIQPPLFVYSTDPSEVRRLLRRERDADDLVNRRTLLAGLASDLGADLGAAFSVGLWRETDEVRDRDTRPASTRSGEAASYERVRLRVSLGATVEYAVVDARTRQVLCEGDVERDVRDTITLHQYSGDWRDLAVDRDDRRLFTDDYREEALASLYVQLQEQLASAVADRAFSCTNRLVP